MNFTDFTEKYNIQLNEQQLRAVQAVDGPVLLLAVPGSGKTTVLVSRLGYMIYCLGIRPESILTVTYTVAATEDMRRRFAKIFGEEDAKRLEFRTINGISQKVLQYFAYRTQKTPFQVADKEASTAVKQSFLEVTGKVCYGKRYQRNTAGDHLREKYASDTGRNPQYGYGSGKVPGDFPDV